MNKRGVSPVIAVLLLVVIAVAAAVLTYIWILSYTGTLQQQSGTEQLQERIKIDGVQVSGNTLTIYVRNIGDVKVNITSAYLLRNDNVLKSNTGLNVEIDPGQVDSSIQLTGVTLDDGQTYVVKVVTLKGTEASYTFTYRS
ncbi:MAG: hypothetical protein DRJ64_01705 [Thermoprotei archaeon]|nr:MAG: hypothetical protein DRJ64_01705 [Thermoprotei archaeon]